MSKIESIFTSLQSQNIPIEKLNPIPIPIRSDFKLSREFVADIRSGILQPLIVRPLKNKPGKYEVVAGMRRYEAAIKAGLKEVPCIIEDLGEADAYLIVIKENYHREEVNPADLASYIRRGTDQIGISEKVLSDKLSISEADILKWIKITKKPEIMENLSNKKMSKEHAFELVDLQDRLDSLRVAKKVTPDRAKQIMRDAISTATNRKVAVLRMQISNDLRGFLESGVQTSLRESDQSPHDSAIERYFADLSSGGAAVDKSWFKPDLVAKLSAGQQRKYGSKFLWIEVIDTHPPEESKIRRLIEVLGNEWRILVYDIRTDKEELFPKK